MCFRLFLQDATFWIAFLVYLWLVRKRREKGAFRVCLVRDGEDAFSTYTDNRLESGIVNESVIEIESESEIVSESEMQICLR